jgi:lipopolysaccharide cholinephosphotransferase
MEDMSYYNPEGSPLRKAQRRMLDIVKAIDVICERHNIQYWADFGTMLGAVRHQGFIPWDDDLDISLFENDYYRLLPLLESELPKEFKLQWHGNEKHFPYSFAKVVDTKSHVDQRSPWAKDVKYQGIWVDIFPMVRGTASVRRIVEPIYGRCYRHVRGYDDNKTSRIAAYILYPFALMAKGMSWIVSCFISGDKFLSAYGVGMPSVHNHTRRRSLTVPVKRLPFEDMMLPFPKDPDAHLRTMYGDYMQFPPVDKRLIHLDNITFFD